MGGLAGYDVTIIDPRAAFASPARFPNVTLRCEWPDEAMTALAPDTRTAIVTLTHDPKLDDPALAVALKSPAFYIGALGSKKTHAARIERLTAQGFDAEALSRIHGPIGLAIGAKSPAEIALSIMAEMTSVLRQ
jgi:xanthine dehydrogenase accessory factor